MKIIVVGTGFVGLPHAAVLAENGHEVHAYDIDAERIAAYSSGDPARIERYVNEPGLAASVAETLGQHLFFTGRIARLGTAAKQQQDQRSDWKQGDFQEPKSTIHR